MSDALFQNFSTVQNSGQPSPVSVTLAATIVPTTFLTIIVGSTTQTVAVVTPPVTGTHVIALQSSITNALTNSGTVAGAITGTLTMVAGSPALFLYNPITQRYKKCE